MLFIWIAVSGDLPSLASRWIFNTSITDLTSLTRSEVGSDVKSVMDVLKIHREAILGKSPETAIQINNSPEPEYESKYLKQRQARFIRE